MRTPKSGDLVEVLVYENDGIATKEPAWKTGVLLKLPASVPFDNLLWVEVLIEGQKIMTTPDKIELTNK